MVVAGMVGHAGPAAGWTHTLLPPPHMRCQAANIQEALEVGASTLLVDEDTSATNFMIRDGLMQVGAPG